MISKKHKISLYREIWSQDFPSKRIYLVPILFKYMCTALKVFWITLMNVVPRLRFPRNTKSPSLILKLPREMKYPLWLSSWKDISRAKPVQVHVYCVESFLNNMQMNVLTWFWFPRNTKSPSTERYEVKTFPRKGYISCQSCLSTCVLRWKSFE